MLVFVDACAADPAGQRRIDADDLAGAAVDRAPHAGHVRQLRRAEQRQQHRVQLVVAHRLFPARGQLGAAAVGQVVEHEAGEVGAADAVGQRYFVGAAPDDGLRAERQAGVAVAIAHIGVAVVGQHLVVVGAAACLRHAVEPRAGAEFPVAAGLPQHIGAGAQRGIAVGLGRVGQGARFQQQIVDAELERGLEAACHGLRLRVTGGGRSSAVLACCGARAGRPPAAQHAGCASWCAAAADRRVLWAPSRGGGSWASARPGRASERLRVSNSFFMGDTPIPGFRRPGLVR
jgi:hypothetical protein